MKHQINVMVLIAVTCLLTGCSPKDIQAAKLAASKVPPMLATKDKVCLLIEGFAPADDPRTQAALHLCATSNDVNLIAATAAGHKACAVVSAQAEAASEDQ
jgi:hypothetical protein